MENVVASIFAVESEAFQALSELRQAPSGTDYFVAEAALVKVEDGAMKLLDGFDTGAFTSNDTAKGIVIGSLVGIIGGPLGVLLGASTGALAGSTIDAGDMLDSASMIEVIAKKLYEGEVAIVALVQEEEPAFDAAFEKFETTTIRFDAVTVVEEVDRAREVEDEIARQAAEKLRAERKAEADARRDERRAAIKAGIDEYIDATNRTMGDIC